MKISDIILEYERGTRVDKETLEAEFDEQYGNPRLPQHIELSKSQIVSLALGIAQKTRMTPGSAIRQATEQLYPKHDVDADVYIGAPDSPKRKDSKDINKDKKIFKVKTDKPEGPGRGKYTQYRDGSDRASSQDFGGDGSGTGARIAKAINPLTGIDTTDFGTVATSAARKARSKMKNLDKFKIQKR